MSKLAKIERTLGKVRLQSDGGAGFVKIGNCKKGNTEKKQKKEKKKERKIEKKTPCVSPDYRIRLLRILLCSVLFVHFIFL